MEALGSFLALRSDLGGDFGGFAQEVGKRDVPGGAAALTRRGTHGDTRWGGS